jgi:RNA polymerase sigma-70 factor, ECF subfamily
VLPHLDAGYNLARWLVRDADDAADVAQEACLRALRYFASFHAAEARPWFLKIVRNTAMSWLAANRSAKVVPLHQPAAESPGAPALEEVLADPADGPETSLGKLEEARLLDGQPSSANSGGLSTTVTAKFLKNNRRSRDGHC